MTINILIPLAGAGIRFQNEGYKSLKPLIPIMGVPLICHALTNIVSYPNDEVKVIIVIRKDHEIKFDLCKKLQNLFSDVYKLMIIQIEDSTEGPLETCFYSTLFVDNCDPLIVMSCDQIMHCDNFKFIQSVPTMMEKDKSIDVSIVCDATEKKEISYWKRGSLFIHFLTKQLQTKKNIAFPAFYQNISKTCKIFPYQLQATNQCFQIKTPNDLYNYLKFNNNLCTRFNFTRFPKIWTIPVNDKTSIELCNIEPKTKINNTLSASVLVVCCILRGSILIKISDTQFIKYEQDNVLFIPPNQIVYSGDEGVELVKYVYNGLLTPLPIALTEYKAFRLCNFDNGKFIGDHGVFFSNDCEISVRSYSKDEIQPIYIHRKCKEYNFVIKGELLVNGNETKENCLFIFNPLQIESLKFHSSFCKILRIKIKSSSSSGLLSESGTKQQLIQLI